METRSSTPSSKGQKVTAKKKQNVKHPVKKKSGKGRVINEKDDEKLGSANDMRLISADPSASLHLLCDEIRPSTDKKGAASLNSLCSDILMRNILPFVGKNQYRFVGAVNRQFRLAYFALFSHTTTYESVSTMKQADLCRQELTRNPSQQALFLKAMVKKGRHNILKFLFSWDICRDVMKELTAAAAKAGHFELLQWLVHKKSRVNATTLEGAAAYGDLDIFQWLCALPPFTLNDSVFKKSDIYETAALHGHLDIIKWASTNSFLRLPNRICSMAARSGHLHVLRWARSENYPWDTALCADAAMNGQLETLKWLRRKGCPWDKWTCFNAAQAGHEDVVTWAASEGCPLSQDLCDKAAEAKNWKMLKIAHSSLGLPLTDTTSLNAIKWGCLTVLKWLHEKKCPWHKYSCRTASGLGNFEVLEWLGAIGHVWDDGTMTSAAMGGHLELIKWLRANGCPWSESACSFAALGGHLDVLMWLRANGCPWDEKTMVFAVKDGYLDILEWARVNGCPASKSICSEAAIFQQLDVLKWAQSHNFCWDETVTAAAFRNMDLEMFNWARANGCPWNAYKCLLKAFEEWDSGVLKWCLRNDVDLSSEICADAALNGDFEFFQWLHKNGCPWDEKSCANAAEKGHHMILDYARKHGCPSKIYKFDVGRDSMEIQALPEIDDDSSSESSDYDSSMFSGNW